MKKKEMAAQPGNLSRQYPYGDTESITCGVLLGCGAALLAIGVPYIMALLKCWGVW